MRRRSSPPHHGDACRETICMSCAKGSFSERRSLSSSAGSANVFATAKLFVPIIVIALIGVVLTEFVMWLERRMSRWRQLERERF